MAGLRVLFIDEVHPILWDSLSEKGYECSDGIHLDRSQILETINDYDGVVIRSRFTIDKEFLDWADNLKFIARSGSGLENIDVEYAAVKQIRVFNSPEGNREAVAEHAMAMILSLMNNVLRSDREVRSGVWKREENRGIEIGGKTVGLIGFGNTGQALAWRLASFGCSVLAYDPYLEYWPSDLARKSSLEEIKSKAHVLSFHVPQNEETEYMLDSGFVADMKNPFWLINTSRGKVVITSALVGGLKSGKILGAGLDVIEYEKKSFERLSEEDPLEDWQYLISSDKVILTPHVAGWTEESYVKLSSFLAEKIIEAFG